MNGLILRLREIGAALPSNEQADIAAPAPAAETWHDSTLALEQGLDVVELPVEEPAQEDPPA